MFLVLTSLPTARSRMFTSSQSHVAHRQFAAPTSLTSLQRSRLQTMLGEQSFDQTGQGPLIEFSRFARGLFQLRLNPKNDRFGFHARPLDLHSPHPMYIRGLYRLA